VTAEVVRITSVFIVVSKFRSHVLGKIVYASQVGIASPRGNIENVGLSRRV
jgi:hypothetical protein